MPFNIRINLPGPITYTKRVGSRGRGRRGCGLSVLFLFGFGCVLLIPMPARAWVVGVAVVLLVVLWVVKGRAPRHHKGGRG